MYMKCKHCQMELEEGTSVCPNCGEIQVEHFVEDDSHKLGSERKNPTWLVSLTIVLAALVLIAMVAVIVLAVNSRVVNEETEPVESLDATVTLPVETTAPQVNVEDFLLYPKVADRASYTASVEELTANGQTVVASAGEFTLTNELLNVFYWVQFNEFMNTNGIYAYYMYGLDDSKPLDTQMVQDTSVTWEQYFLDAGMSLWYQCALLNTMAKEAGYSLEEDLVKILDEMLTGLEKDALENGYANADALVADAIGPGCTAKGYYDYMVFYWTGMYYYVELTESMAPTDEQIQTYFQEHSAEFEASGITADMAPFVDVRHILVMPKGGTTNVSGSTTYSEEEWETCRQAAQAILDTWTAGEATEESFAALANQHSEDGGSNTTGGLYEAVTNDGTYVPEFEAWCVAEGRQVGDTGIVKTTYGYHVMYCSAIHEAWYQYALQSLVQELYAQQMDQYAEKTPFDFDTTLISLGGIPAQQATPEATTPAQ